MKEFVRGTILKLKRKCPLHWKDLKKKKRKVTSHSIKITYAKAVESSAAFLYSHRYRHVHRSASEQWIVFDELIFIAANISPFDVCRDVHFCDFGLCDRAFLPLVAWAAFISTDGFRCYILCTSIASILPFVCAMTDDIEDRHCHNAVVFCVFGLQ